MAKYIFDFDDVLFHTREFIKHEYLCFEKFGISSKEVDLSYKEDKKRGELFSMKRHIKKTF